MPALGGGGLRTRTGVRFGGLFLRRMSRAFKLLGTLRVPLASGSNEMLKVAVENCPEIAIIDAVRRAGPFDEGLHVFGYHLVEGFRLGRAATVGGGNAMGVCCWHAVAARKTETRRCARLSRGPLQGTVGVRPHRCVHQTTQRGSGRVLVVTESVGVCRQTRAAVANDSKWRIDVQRPFLAEKGLARSTCH